MRCAQADEGEEFNLGWRSLEWAEGNGSVARWLNPFYFFQLNTSEQNSGINIQSRIGCPMHLTSALVQRHV